MVSEDYYHPRKRFPGSGGANEVSSLCWRTIVIIMHEKRRFVEKLDFLTSPGFLDGTPGAREREGLPPGTGPYRVVTSRALFGFGERSRRMKLLGVLKGFSQEEILAEMDFVPEVAEQIEKLEPPTPAELRLLREEIDPDKAIIGRGKVIGA